MKPPKGGDGQRAPDGDRRGAQKPPSRDGRHHGSGRAHEQSRRLVMQRPGTVPWPFASPLHDDRHPLGLVKQFFSGGKTAPGRGRMQLHAPRYRILVSASVA